MSHFILSMLDERGEATLPLHSFTLDREHSASHYGRGVLTLEGELWGGYDLVQPNALFGAVLATDALHIAACALGLPMDSPLLRQISEEQATSLDADCRRRKARHDDTDGG